MERASKIITWRKCCTFSKYPSGQEPNRWMWCQPPN